MGFNCTKMINGKLLSSFLCIYVIIFCYLKIEKKDPKLSPFGPIYQQYLWNMTAKE